VSNDNVIIIGAGPAGLATAAELRRRGVAATVLERADAIGASWRSRYDRLRLNSSRWFSKLPNAPYPRGTGLFPSRDEVVGYLEAYAERHELDVRFATEVERIDPVGGAWALKTSAGTVGATQVVVAAGYEHTPIVPAWPGRDRFAGTLLHSGAYRNPAPFRGDDVLVVGPGCSGMEIAYDLSANGAARVRLAVRTPPNMIVRSPIGPFLARMLMRLPTARADKIMRSVMRRQVGDLSEYGLPLPEEGIASRLKRLKLAPTIVDSEMLDAIRSRRIEVVAAVDTLDEAGAVLADGTRADVDAIVAATGWRPGLEPVLGHLDVLDDHGAPLATGDQPAAPGLRFVGYVVAPAPLGLMGREARGVAKAIAGELSTVPRAATMAAAFGTSG
jgi:cation diffusion facilitator CzcD-associated flavoprotein CzcO